MSTILKMFCHVALNKYRNYCIYLVISFITITLTNHSNAQISYDTTLYSSFVLVNSDTAYIFRSDLDFIKSAENRNFKDAIKKLNQQKYKQTNLDINYYQAEYYSRMDMVDSAVKYMLLKPADRFLIKNAQYFDIPYFFNCLSSKVYRNYMDTFFIKNTNIYPNADFACSLHVIGLKDQAYYDYLNYLDENDIKDKVRLNDSIWRLKKILQTENEKEFNILIKHYGWPTIDKVGKTASSYGALVVQHSTNIDFQALMLDTLFRYANTGKVEPQFYALLKDRFLIRTGKKQIYGTQLIEMADGFKKLNNHVDIDTIEMNRKSLGLIPLNEYLKRFNMNYSGNLIINPSFETKSHSDSKVSSQLGYNIVDEKDVSYIVNIKYYKNSTAAHNSGIEYFPDGDNAAAIYTCVSSNFHTTVSGTFKESLRKGNHYIFSFYSNTCNNNPIPKYISVYFEDDLKNFSLKNIKLNNTLKFDVILGNKWHFYSDTILLTKDCQYFMIGESNNGRCSEIKSPRPEIRTNMLFDMLSLRKISTLEDTLKITMPFDSLEISLFHDFNITEPVNWDHLNKAIINKDIIKVKIISWADKTGSKEFNEILTAQRAESIEKHLRRKLNDKIPIETQPGGELTKYKIHADNRRSIVIIYYK